MQGGTELETASNPEGVKHRIQGGRDAPERQEGAHPVALLKPIPGTAAVLVASAEKDVAQVLII